MSLVPRREDPTAQQIIARLEARVAELERALAVKPESDFCGVAAALGLREQIRSEMIRAYLAGQDACPDCLHPWEDHPPCLANPECERDACHGHDGSDGQCDCRRRRKEGTWPQECVQRAFVEGMAWWQFHHNGSTAFPSEIDEAEAEAIRRYGRPQKERTE